VSQTVKRKRPQRRQNDFDILITTN